MFLDIARAQKYLPGGLQVIIYGHTLRIAAWFAILPKHPGKRSELDMTTCWYIIGKYRFFCR
jgi:hypothetical protein